MSENNGLKKPGFPQTLMVYAVTSILAGWASGDDSSANRFNPNYWPPNVKRIIPAGHSKTIPPGQTVKPTDDSEPGSGQCWSRNIELQGPGTGKDQAGGTLINQGTISGMISEGKRNYNYLVTAFYGQGMTVKNEGSINASEDPTVSAAQAMIIVGGTDNSAVNKGTMNIVGTDPANSEPNENARGMEVICRKDPDDAGNYPDHTGPATATNDPNAIINVDTDNAHGISVREGTATNKGIINVNARGASGMASQIRSWEKSPDKPELRQATVTNEGSIRVNALGYGMVAHDENPDLNPDQTIKSRAINAADGEILVNARKAIGMFSVEPAGVLENHGRIEATDKNSDAIRLSAGTATNTGIITTSGKKADAINLKAGTVTNTGTITTTGEEAFGILLLEENGAGSVNNKGIINVSGLYASGVLSEGGGLTNSGTITSKETAAVQLTGQFDEKSPVSFEPGTRLSGKPAIKIAADGKDGPSVRLGKGEYEGDVSVIGHAKAIIQGDWTSELSGIREKPLNIIISDSGRVDEIDFSSGGDRPPLITEVGGKLGRLSAKSGLGDTLRLTQGSVEQASDLDKVHITGTQAPWKLKVTGTEGKGNGTEGKENSTVTLVTASGEPLKNIVIDSGVTVSDLILGEGGLIGTVDNQGTLEKVSVVGTGGKIGNVTDAGELTTSSAIGQIMVAGHTDKPVQPLADIRFTTTQPLMVSATGDEGRIGCLQLVDDGKLGTVNGVETLQIIGAGWQADWITDLQTLKADYFISELHIAGETPEIPTPEIADLNQLKLQTASQPVSITTDVISASTISQLTIHDNGKLNGAEFRRVKGADGKIQGTRINIAGSDWTSAAPVVDPLSIDVNGGLQTLRHSGVATDPLSTDPETMNINFTGTEGEFRITVHEGAGVVDFSSQAERPPLRFVQAGGITAEARGNGKVFSEDLTRNDTLEIKSGSVTSSSGFMNTAVTGSDWSSVTLTDPASIQVDTKGSVARIGVGQEKSDSGDTASITLASASSGSPGNKVNVVFTGASPVSRIHLADQDLQGFLVSNTGGTIEEVDFSDSSAEKPQARPTLVLNQSAGTTGSVTGSQSRHDQLVISGGAVGAVSGFEGIHVTGKEWTCGVIADPMNIELLKSSETDLLTTLQTDSVKPERLTLIYNDEFKGGSSITSGGIINTIDLLDDHANRPGIHITQNGGTIGTIKGKRHDSLNVTGSEVSGDITGLGAVCFSGMETRFGGQNIATAGTVSIGSKDQGKPGRLTLTAGKTVTIKPPAAMEAEKAAKEANTTVHIEKGGTLVTTQHGGTHLDITGTYYQEGTLKADLQSQLAQAQAQIQESSQPLVKASAIKLGDQAVLELSGDLPDNGADTSLLLMESGSAIDGKAPVINLPAGTTRDIRYTYFNSSVSDTKLLLTGSSLGKHYADLAATGRASVSEQQAIKVATDPKGNNSVIHSTDPDPLNTWVRTQSGKVNNDPVELAKIARQMTPDISGGATGMARAGLQQAGNAIGSRQSSLRTGVATGDMLSSGGVWLQYAYHDATQEMKDDVYGYEAKTHGFSVGTDSEFKPNALVGIAYTYANGDVTGTDGSTSKVDTEGHIFSLYTSVTEGTAFLDGIFSYSFGKNDGQRSVQGSAINASYDTSSWELGLMTGYQLPLARQWHWQPQLAFRYASIEVDDYREEAGSGDASILRFDKVSNEKFEIMELGAGIKLTGDIETGNMTLKPEASLMGYHNFKDDPVTITAQYAAGGNSFVVHGASPDDNRLQLGVGANMELNNNVTLTLSYSYNWMEHFSAHGFMARARFEF